MYTFRRRYLGLILIALVLLTAGCQPGQLFGPEPTPTPTPTPTPVPISDAEFSQLVSGICETIKSDIELVNETTENIKERIGLTADALENAALKMEEIDVDEANAPNAFLLRKSLSERGDLLVKYSSALTEALNKIDIPSETSIRILVTEDGSVFAIFEENLEILDIDQDLVLALNSNYDDITQSAEALSLEDCIP